MIRTVLDQNVNVIIGEFVVLNSRERVILASYSYFCQSYPIVFYHRKRKIKTGDTPKLVSLNHIADYPRRRIVESHNSHIIISNYTINYPCQGRASKD